MHVNSGLHRFGSRILRGILGEKTPAQVRSRPSIPGGESQGRPMKTFVRVRMSSAARFVRRHPKLHGTARSLGAWLDRASPGFAKAMRLRTNPDIPGASGLAGTAAKTYQITDRFLMLEFRWKQTARPTDYGSTDSRALAAGFAEVVFRDPASKGRPLANVDFRLGGNSLVHALYGFSHIEAWGTWTTGGRSAVIVWLPDDAPETCEIEVRAGIFEPAFDVVEAEVFANGVTQGVITLDGRNSASLPVKLDAPRLSELAPTCNLSLESAARPDVSIIILNYSKPAITLASVLSILRSETQLSYEIIVLDNGSNAEAAIALAEMKLPVRLIRLRANRFFGEGNNIAAEAARAPLMLFLNNDAFLTDGSLDELAAPLTDPSVGIVGPVFRYPDTTLQEAGAFINPDGTAFQRGKLNEHFDINTLRDSDPVDYVSAACLMIRSDDFYALGGFDLRYDPAYYEDSDLCLRMLSLGKSTVVARKAMAFHVENATTSDPRNKGIATNIVDRHRQIFLSRWGSWLQNRRASSLPSVEPLDPGALRDSIRVGKSSETINAVYTPFPLVQGGGERYILGVAQALSELAPTAVTTPDEYSGLRLNTLVRELGYAPYHSFPEVERRLQNRDVEHFVLMGNELLPTRSGYGDNRIYHCQFPFPIDLSPAMRKSHADNLRAYKAVVVNSRFTRDAYLREYLTQGLAQPPRMEIIPPPVRLIGRRVNGHAPEKENLIACIGRFSPRGHAKRQDAVIEAFSRLVRSGRLNGWRLVVCGVVPNDPEAIAYYVKLQDMVEEIVGAEIRLAPSRAQIDDLLCRAKVYISATGFGVDEAMEPWRCEHFGITVVEAASAGCVPVAHRSGGPVEIVDHLGAGFLFRDSAELEDAIVNAANVADDRTLRSQIIDRSEAYSEVSFFERWGDIVKDVRTQT